METLVSDLFSEHGREITNSELLYLRERLIEYYSDGNLQSSKTQGMKTVSLYLEYSLMSLLDIVLVINYEAMR